MTCDNYTRHSMGDGKWRLEVTCNFDTSPATAVAAMPAGVMDLINTGLYIYKFAIRYGGTSDNSDLQILDEDGFTIISASGNGLNVIDNATNTSWIYGDGPTVGSTNAYPLGDGKDWTITVTGNTENNSHFKLIMLGS